jgi:cell division protein FtsW
MLLDTTEHWPNARWLILWGISVQPSEIIRPAALIAVGVSLYSNLSQRRLVVVLLTMLVIAGGTLLREGDGSAMALTAVGVSCAVWILRGPRVGGAVLSIGLLGIAMWSAHHSTSLSARVTSRVQVVRIADTPPPILRPPPVLEPAVLRSSVRVRPGSASHYDFLLGELINEWGPLPAALILITTFEALILVLGAATLASPPIRAIGTAWTCMAAAELAAHSATNLAMAPTVGVNWPFLGGGGSSLLGHSLIAAFVLSTAGAEGRVQVASSAAQKSKAVSVTKIAVRGFVICVMYRLATA